MDSKQRHELQENDLANMLTGAKSVWNDKEWWTRYGNYILLVLLLVSAAFLAKKWADSRTAAVNEQKWADLGLANSPESFDGIASSYSDSVVKSLALLRAGDLLAQRAAAGESIITTVAGLDGTDAKKVTTDPAKDAQDAVLRYQDVINMTTVQPLVRFNALMGLASVYEDLGEWAKAKATYEQVAKEGKEISPIIAVRAKNRLEILPRLNEPVVFAPEPVAAAGNAGINSPLPGLGTVPLTTQTVAPAGNNANDASAKDDAASNVKPEVKPEAKPQSKPQSKPAE